MGKLIFALPAILIVVVVVLVLFKGAPPEPIIENAEDMEVTGVTGETENLDLTGTHIMPNGDVMTGKGVVIESATVLSDGTIQLVDGTVITPTFDLRK